MGELTSRGLAWLDLCEAKGETKGGGAIHGPPPAGFRRPVSPAVESHVGAAMSSLPTRPLSLSYPVQEYTQTVVRDSRRDSGGGGGAGGNLTYMLTRQAGGALTAQRRPVCKAVTHELRPDLRASIARTMRPTVSPPHPPTEWGHT